VRSSGDDPSFHDEPLMSPDVLIYRSAVLLYIVGIVTSQVAAHVGAFPVANLRLFELLGLLASGILVGWMRMRARFGSRGLVALSWSGALLIAVAVGLGGGSDSPLWVLYLFPVVFNGLYLSRRVTWTTLVGIILLSALPALIAGDRQQLLVQLLMVAPIYGALTEIAIMLVSGLHRAAQLQARALQERLQHAETRRWSDRLEALSVVTQSLTGQPDVKAIAATIIEQTQRAIPYDSARVYIREQDDLVPIAFRGLGAYAFETNDLLRVRLGEGITGWVAQQAQPLIVNDASTDIRAVLIPGTPAEAESMLCAPLIYEEMVTGVVVLVKRGRNQFSTSDLQLLTLLAGQAANALAKASLLAASRERADTDGLTGLLNHRAVRERLTACLERASADSDFVSVIMIDIDGFKRVNDTCGHLAGDTVLHQVAHMLRNACRSTDLIARFGGDEFLLVLPDRTTTEATRLADRIVRQAAQEMVLRDDGSRLGATVRLSAGVATFPRDGTTTTDLIAVADRRLYIAKGTRHPSHGSFTG
jgi:diguanylate cyclase (GGDEF)-like protein